MSDLEDIYGPLVISADNTGRSPDPADEIPDHAT